MSRSRERERHFQRRSKHEKAARLGRQHGMGEVKVGAILGEYPVSVETEERLK